MMMKPDYDEIIIVGVISQGEFNWYITDKNLWIMDLSKVHEQGEGLRRGIDILSEKNCDIFLDRIKEYKADINVLRLEILNKIEKKDYELEEYYPCLMIDFDNKILYSQYPEPFGFENYVPDEWKGKYTSFINYIDSDNKYWIYKNKNILSKID